MCRSTNAALGTSEDAEEYKFLKSLNAITNEMGSNLLLQYWVGLFVADLVHTYSDKNCSCVYTVWRSLSKTCLCGPTSVEVQRKGGSASELRVVPPSHALVASL